MDPIPGTIIREGSRRALLGARFDDPVVSGSPALLTRARRALPRRRDRRAAASGAPAVTRPRPAARC